MSFRHFANNFRKTHATPKDRNWQECFIISILKLINFLSDFFRKPSRKMPMQNNLIRFFYTCNEQEIPAFLIDLICSKFFVVAQFRMFDGYTIKLTIFKDLKISGTWCYGCFITKVNLKKCVFSPLKHFFSCLTSNS